MTRRQFLHHASGALLTLKNAASPQPQPGGAQVFYDPAVLRHEPASDHPESPKRLDAVMGTVRSLERQGRLSVAAPRPATDEDVLLVHTSEYVKKVRAEIAAKRRTLSTGDTALSPGSLAAALAAAGTVVSAVDAVMNGRTRTAFCAVRPPGHHASQARGMGFCVFNNIAIGARHAQRTYGVDRILIADWDVHHGNGTQDIFWSDGGVLFFDIHQHPWYPGTGSADERGDGKGRGLIVNNPFPAGSGRTEILGVFREALVPAAERFKPQLVMISAGFDSRAGDPLGRFTLTDQDFAELTGVVLGIARQHAGGRLVSVLEGGYSLEGLPLAVSSHLTRLAS
ncbi:MAG TPA: histone deacetylase [Vicinamibacterales bacterium]|jgi:acetoin utilization deacetylase AcuC-like enzyme|nr:histone deacetylase [Vicinamibacterales bacterium]